MKKSVLIIILLILLIPISLAYEEKTYIYGIDLIASKEGNNIQYYNQDYLSSNRIISNNNGNIIGKNTQEPYGSNYEEKGNKEALSNDYKFTGKEEDTDNLYYFGARYYEPGNGRFISVDPVFDSSKSPYAYADNNPLKYVDPSGMINFDPLKEAFDLTDEQIYSLRKGEDLLLPTRYFDYGNNAYVEFDFLIKYNPSDEIINYGIAYIKSEPRKYGMKAFEELEETLSEVSAKMSVKNANLLVLIEHNKKLFEHLRKYRGFEDIPEFKTNVFNTHGLVEDIAPAGAVRKVLRFNGVETASRVAGKSIRRLLAERGLKMVPVLGIGIGIWGTYNEVRTGDFVGAGAECIGAFCDPVDYIALLGLVCPNIETTGEGERMMEVGKYDEKNNAYR